MTDLRWCLVACDDKIRIFGRPTATDALEFAEALLNDAAEFDCCKTDSRLEDFKNIKELLNSSK